MRQAKEVLTLLDGLVASEEARPRGRRERLVDANAVVKLIRNEVHTKSLDWGAATVLAVDAIETECRDAQKRTGVQPRKQFVGLIRAASGIQLTRGTLLAYARRFTSPTPTISS
mmetsp:Transcript_13897/g.20119  ORF Transcript_13897/g.20119 Transcript_13897/m.20119 type:complete len:114 (+) Transcript_13897:83-424(+)